MIFFNLWNHFCLIYFIWRSMTLKYESWRVRLVIQSFSLFLFIIDNLLLVLEANYLVSLAVYSQCLERGLLLKIFQLLHCKQLLHCQVCSSHELEPADDFKFLLAKLVRHMRKPISPCMKLATPFTAPSNNTKALEAKFDFCEETNWNTLQNHGFIIYAVAVFVLDF